MSFDCIDVCDRVIEEMCHHCPNFKYCQGGSDEEEVNHVQMSDCLGRMKFDNYPDRNEICDPLGKNNDARGG